MSGRDVCTQTLCVETDSSGCCPASSATPLFASCRTIFCSLRTRVMALTWCLGLPRTSPALWLGCGSRRPRNPGCILERGRRYSTPALGQRVSGLEERMDAYPHHCMGAELSCSYCCFWYGLPIHGGYGYWSDQTREIRWA